MAKLTTKGEQVLKSKNFTTHTRIYVNNQLQVDTATGKIYAPVVNYQINRSRKLGAATLNFTVSNTDGKYSFHRSEDPLFGYGNKIRLEEGLQVGESIEWFTRFTGVIVKQVATNAGGMPTLQVAALDNMKMLLDYLPDEILYRPKMVKVAGEALKAVGESFQHYRGNQENLPWADIPYPIFYKNGVKLKENYEIDLINGEIYFGEQMWRPSWQQATKVTTNEYAVSGNLPAKPIVRRSFKLIRYNGNGNEDQQFNYAEIPSDVGISHTGGKIYFTKDPFHDLDQGQDWVYLEKKIVVTVGTVNEVTVDYWYYDDNTNLAEDVIKDIALRAGFKEEQIQLAPTQISLRTLRFTNQTVKNGFEMLQKVKQQLSPNYIITCDDNGNLRGYYASQMTVADYELELIKQIEAPISEESLYTGVVAHGLTMNPNDLAVTASVRNLLNSTTYTPPNSGGVSLGGILNTGGIQGLATKNSSGWFLSSKKKVSNNTSLNVSTSGALGSLINKNVEDQVSWHWRQKNDDTPPKFPIDLLEIALAEPKRIEEINILVGDYKKGTIEQAMSVLVTENGEDWFYVDRNQRGVQGASSQWLTIKGGELEFREISGVKIRVEAGFNWTETHTWSETSGGFLGIGADTDVHTDYYYNWFVGIKEIQIWEKKELEVTSVLGNYLGTGDGERQFFYFANVPLIKNSERIYVDGNIVPREGYQVKPETGEVKFYMPPVGIVTSDYSAEVKVQALTQSEYIPRYGSNVTITNPPGILVFKGGDIQPGSTAHRILNKIGMKKISIPTDNYLNTMSAIKLRGEEMLQEITRLEETLTIDAVYRPDVDICQTIRVWDPILGISGHYFVEEITEGKQGYKPQLNIRVSKYSL